MKKYIYIFLFLPFFINGASLDSKKVQVNLHGFLEMACIENNIELLNNIIAYFEKLEKAKKSDSIPEKLNSAGYLSIFLEDKVDMFEILLKYAKTRSRLFVRANIICPIIEAITKSMSMNKAPNQVCDNILRSFWQHADDTHLSDFIHMIYIYCFPSMLKTMIQYYPNLIAYWGDVFIVNKLVLEILKNNPKEEIICCKYEKLSFLLDRYCHNLIYNDQFIKSIVTESSMLSYLDYLFIHSYEPVSENLATILLLVVVAGNYDQKYFDYLMTRFANFYNPAFDNYQEGLQQYLSARESALDLSL